MDKKIYLSKFPLSFTNLDNLIGEGANGSIYRISDNEVFKKFNQFLIYETNLEFLVNQCSENIVFPKKLVYLNNRLIGYVMDYVDGVVFRKISDKVELDKLLISVRKLEEDIKEQSLNSICIYDLNYGNIMWTSNNELKIIDTDLYYYDSTAEVLDLYSDNLSQFNNIIITKIIGDAPFIIGDHYLEQCFKKYLLNGKMLVSIFLDYLLNYLKDMTCNRIITIGDMKESLSLVRKR